MKQTDKHTFQDQERLEGKGRKGRHTVYQEKSEGKGRKTQRKEKRRDRPTRIPIGSQGERERKSEKE